MAASLPVPEGFHSVNAMLAVRDAKRALEFYGAAFGAQELFRLTDPQGGIVHAEVRIGDAVVMLSEENPRFNASPQSLNGTSVILHMYCSDVDAVWAKALLAGAEEVFPLKDQFYGDRAGRLRDPFGHLWLLSSRCSEVSPAEMQRRLDEMYKQQ